MSKSLAILTVYQELTCPSSPLWTLLSNTINPIILPVTQMPFGSSSPLVLIVNLVLLLFYPSLFLLTDDAFFLYKRLRYRHITNVQYCEKLKVQNWQQSSQGNLQQCVTHCDDSLWCTSVVMLFLWS